MKTTLEYHGEADHGAAIRAMCADDLCAYIWDIRQILRKYNDLPEGMTADGLIDAIREEIYQAENDGAAHAMSTFL